MPMPTSTTVISCGVFASSLNPNASAAATISPVAAPPTTTIASSGSTAASGPRKKSRLSPRTAPNRSTCARIARPSPAFAASAIEAMPPVKPACSRAARACSAKASRNCR